MLVPKIYFGNLNLNLPSDFDEKNFNSIKNYLKKLKVNHIQLIQLIKFLMKLIQLLLLEQYKFIKANVVEEY